MLEYCVKYKKNLNINRVNPKDNSTIYGILVYNSGLDSDYYKAMKPKEKLA